MRVAGANERNRDFINWIQQFSYDPALNGNIEVLGNIKRFRHLGEMVAYVYPLELLENYLTDLDTFCLRFILSPFNASVNDINNCLINQILGTLQEVHSTD